MPWSVNKPSDSPVVEISFSGELSPVELDEGVRRSIEVVVSTNQYKVLCDCTELLGGHSVVDLYVLADLVLATGHGHQLKEAVILPTLPDSAKNVQFWETTCHNRGINVRIFLDRQSALAWLLS